MSKHKKSAGSFQNLLLSISTQSYTKYRYFTVTPEKPSTYGNLHTVYCKKTMNTHLKIKKTVLNVSCIDRSYTSERRRGVSIVVAFEAKRVAEFFLFVFVN